jgi:hypothetical protein
MTIEQLPKGAIPDPVDERDYQISFGAAPIDWTKEYRLPNPGDEDQGQSLSCVAQAWSYYHVQIRPKDFSRRDIYAQIHLPEGGAYIRDGGLRIVKNGQATRDEVPDPKPQTETNMRDKSGITAEKEASDIERDSFLIKDGTIDGVAAAIRDYKGVVFGVSGTNKGWQNMYEPNPPTSPSEPGIWGHALYAMGYHLHNSQKCIIAKSSWCNAVKEHHIKQNYFDSGMTFNAWTLIPKDEFMTNSLLVKKGGEYGFYDPATSEDGLITMMRHRGINPPLKPDGHLDWTSVDDLIKGNVV